MKTQAKAKLHSKTVSELKEDLKKLYQDQVTTTQLLKLGKETNTKQAASIRHQIAVINTIIREKELESTQEK